MGRDPGFLYLSEDDLGALNITTAETIGAIETAVAAKADGKVWTAPKAAIVPGDGRYLMATLAAAEEPRIAAGQIGHFQPAQRRAGASGDQRCDRAPGQRFRDVARRA